MARGVPVGSRKTFGGKEYIKTEEGWRYVGKGKGKKAQEHVSKHKTSAQDESKKTSGKDEQPSVEDHAKETSTEDLKKFVETSQNQDLKKIAEKELKNREGGEEEESQNTPEQEEDDTSSNKDQQKEDNNTPESDNDQEEPEQEIEEEEETSLPNEESVQDASILSEKDGPEKLNEKKEGFGMKDTEPLTDSGDSGKEEKGEESDINHKFEAFGRFAAGVIKGRMKSLIAYGSGGVGKTFTVTQELKKAGKKIFDPELHDPGDDNYDYVKLTGKMTAAAVYKAMYEHNGKILLFDDCDSVLQDENAINLFKGALDTSGDGTIDWGSSKKIKGAFGDEIPQKFKFEGRAMFISNLDIEGKAGEMLQPIVSRGYGINLSMDRKATMDRIRHIATSADGKLTNLKFPGIPDYTHEDMETVLAYADKHREKAADLNVRTIGTLLAIKKDAEAAGVPWERDAQYVYLRKSEEPDIYNGGLFNKQRRAIEKAMGIDSRSIEEKKIEWCDLKKAFMKDRITSKIYKK